MKLAFVYNKKRTDSIDEAEFDSSEAIESISEALKSCGDTVIEVEMTKDGKWIDDLAQVKPDLVFNTAEGFKGIAREAYAPTVYDQLNLNYVGSEPYACFLTLDKFLTKKVVDSKGVPVADGFFVSTMGEIEVLSRELDYPVFVKPNFEGSSKGISRDSKCSNELEFIRSSKEVLANFPQGLLVEKYIDGKDVTVPFINGIGENGVLEPIEYIGTMWKGDQIYDYKLKNFDDHKVEAKCPADIEPQVREKLMKYTKIAVEALGVNDVTRADFRVTSSGEIYFLEVNALPSLQKRAGIFLATGLLGLGYNETIQKIVRSAVQRSNNRGIKKSRQLKKKAPNIALVYNIKRKSPGDLGYEQEAEFDSLETIQSISSAIIANGYNCRLIEANRDLSKKLQHHEIDVVFNIAEGMNKKTREAQVPALCDLLGIEHTGSDAACLSLTLNKSLSNKVVGAEGCLVPKSVLFHPCRKKIAHNLRYPIILKPNLEGSSKGIYQNSVVTNEEELKVLLNELYKDYNDYILAEEYISGREFTVGIIGNSNLKILGISEVVFNRATKYPVYSYELKQIDDPFNNSEFCIQSPPDITPSLHKKICRVTKRIFQITGCQDVARIDFKVDDKNDIYFIEVNPLPGLTPGFSDLPVLAERNGVSYHDLIGSILKPAIGRWRKQK